MLAYPSIFSRLTTGLDFTTSVCELPCASSTFLTVNTVCADCIYYMLCSPRHNLASFLSAAQFLTVNSGGRFFNRTHSVLLSSTSERPSTAKTTQHPDLSIDPQVDPSHPSPHPSFPLCSSDLMSRSKYWSASGPSLLRSPSPPSPPMVLTMIYPKQAYFIDCP